MLLGRRHAIRQEFVKLSFKGKDRYTIRAVHCAFYMSVYIQKMAYCEDHTMEMHHSSVLSLPYISDTASSLAIIANWSNSLPSVSNDRTTSSDSQSLSLE